MRGFINGGGSPYWFTVNKTGRQREKSGLYKNSKEGCKSFRVRGINDKY